MSSTTATRKQVFGAIILALAFVAHLLITLQNAQEIEQSRIDAEHRHAQLVYRIRCLEAGQ